MDVLNNDDIMIHLDQKMSTQEAADRWNTDKSVVAKWCRDGHIEGAEKSKSFPFAWEIPFDAKRPIDKELISEIIWQIVEVKNGVASDFDLTKWGIPSDFVDGYIAAIVSGLYLRRTQTGDLVLTRKGFEIINRGKGGEVPEVLIWTASAAGAFTGMLLRQALPQ